MKKWINTNKLYVAGALIGAIAGFLYWQQIGCSSGTCMITSKPFNSTIYGALMGALLFGIFKKENKEPLIEEEKNRDHDI
ncbi:MAG: DUF6132 family protein [Ferruginibacter sp.]